MGRFSKQYGSRPEAIITECDFSSLDGQRQVTASRTLWDTGSTSTILSHHLIAELKPEPFQQGGVTGIGGDAESNTYLIHVLLPSGDAVAFVEVYEADIEDYDAIIGMDIITRGNFHLDCNGDKIEFTFSI